MLGFRGLGFRPLLYSTPSTHDLGPSAPYLRASCGLGAWGPDEFWVPTPGERQKGYLLVQCRRGHMGIFLRGYMYVYVYIIYIYICVHINIYIYIPIYIYIYNMKELVVLRLLSRQL